MEKNADGKTWLPLVAAVCVFVLYWVVIISGVLTSVFGLWGNLIAVGAMFTIVPLAFEHFFPNLNTATELNITRIG